MKSPDLNYNNPYSWIQVEKEAFADYAISVMRKTRYNIVEKEFDKPCRDKSSLTFKDDNPFI